MQTSQCLSYRSLQERKEGLGGLPNLLMKGEKEVDWEERKVDNDDDEEMEGNTRDEEDMHNGGGHDSQIPLGSFCHLCSSCFKVLSSKKKLNNSIVDTHKGRT